MLICKYDIFWHAYKSSYLYTDIDECLEGLDNCHPTNADCKNSIGSFSCACHSGYSGDGIDCISKYWSTSFIFQ